MMNDLISRQDAIYIIKQYFKKNYVVDGEWYADEIIRELEGLPSSEKTGKWISKLHSNWGKWGIYVASCSECGFSGGAGKWNFCPNCGARMEGEEDGQNTV